MRRNLRLVALVLVVCLAVVACQPANAAPAVSILSVSFTPPEGTEFETGEAIGLTVHFDQIDQDIHGLPESAELIASSPWSAAVLVTMQAWVGKTTDDQILPFDCFGTIEVRDERGDVLLEITEFCDSVGGLAFPVISGRVLTSAGAIALATDLETSKYPTGRYASRRISP